MLEAHLVGILHATVSSIGTYIVTECMRLHETMGITQNRVWGVCSLNDFRRFLGLKRESPSCVPSPFCSSQNVNSVYHLPRVELGPGNRERCREALRGHRIPGVILRITGGGGQACCGRCWSMSWYVFVLIL